MNLGIAIDVTITMNQDFLDQLEEWSREAQLEAAKLVLLPALQQVLSVDGPPPSNPGEPPHRQSPADHARSAMNTGLPPLWQSLYAKDDVDGVLIGSVDPYGLYLELGTQHIAPRPWFLVTILDPQVQMAYENVYNAILARLMGAEDDSGPQPVLPYPTFVGGMTNF